jgi:tmRNA-binding protein
MTVRNASHEQLRNSLLKLDEIKALEAIGSKDKSTINVRIYPKPGFVPVIEDLTAVVMQEGWELRDISMRRGHLDEVFREITTNHKV